jgi:LysM repeat protein
MTIISKCPACRALLPGKTDSAACARVTASIVSAKQIVLLLTFTLCATPDLRAQDAATEERLKKLNGYVEELLADKARQQKQISELAREVESLRDQLSKPSGNYASQDDLRELAKKVQDIDRKRMEDDAKIVQQIEDLGKTVFKPAGGAKAKPTPIPENTGTGGAPRTRMRYEIQPGDTLSVIVQAYREKGIKVSVDQILKANPGLVPEKMKVGQKIFIPAPAK